MDIIKKALAASVFLLLSSSARADGPIPGYGGLSIGAGTSGGVVYFKSAISLASSGLLLSNQLMVGGGAGAGPSTVTTGSGILAALASAPSGSGVIALVSDPAMTITTTGGSAARSVQNHFADILNAADYGTNALQSGLSYRQGNGGGGLSMNPGSSLTTSAGYTYTGSVDLLLQGQGFEATQIGVTGSGTAGLTIGTAGTDVTQDINLRDFLVNGSTGTGNNIVLNSLHNDIVSRVRSSNSGAGDGLLAVRSYSTFFDDLYANNNGGNGLELSAPVAGIGNDNIHIHLGHFLANTGDGFKSGGQWVGGTSIGTDMEGNAIGMELDGGPLNPSYSDTIIGDYFENQTGLNFVAGHDSGSVVVPALTLMGNIFNPGTVSASANEVEFDRVRSAFVVNNHFSTVNFAVTSNTFRLLVGPNEYSTAVGPWQPSASPSSYKEPILYQLSNVGTDFAYGFAPQGWNTRAQLGQTFAGNWVSLSQNWLPSSNAGAGTQYDNTNGSGDIDVGPNQIKMWIGAAGAGSLQEVMAATASGTEIFNLTTNVVTVSALPSCASSAGMRSMVSDATAAASGNFGAAVTGSGSNTVPVYCDGTSWKIG